MDFKTYSAISAQEIQVEVTKLSARWVKQTVSPQLVKLIRMFTRGVHGGKCLRGTLVKLGYTLYAPYAPEVLTIAAAFEVLHSGLLVHDDIIDKSALRRGKPALHVLIGDDHYGVSQALCLGDISFFWITEVIAASPYQSRAKALALLSQIIADTMLGEMLDVTLALPQAKKKVKDINTIQKYKTALYTVSGPLLIGATLADAPENILSGIRVYGEYIGTAFQIQDDILGTFGDERVVGKSVTSDIEENKNTLLIAYALQKATPIQRKTLETLYGKGHITPQQHQTIKEIFEATGAVRYCQNKARRYCAKGKAAIPLITSDPDMQQLLHECADFMIMRKK
jgi:geranylgeranyl diphosphate synthase, type I